MKRREGCPHPSSRALPLYQDGTTALACARLADLRARLNTPDPAAAQAALDEYTEAVMEACGAIDAERTPRTISARAVVARLLGLPEVAR